MLVVVMMICIRLKEVYPKMFNAKNRKFRLLSLILVRTTIFTQYESNFVSTVIMSSPSNVQYFFL